LVDKGLVKLGNFRKNPRKGQYAYILTPKGIREKSLLTHNFIERKREEFEVLRSEIKALEEEAGHIAEAMQSLRGGKQWGIDWLLSLSKGWQSSPISNVSRYW